MKNLTPRQRQIANLLATGQSQSEIAHRLGVKRSTVYRHTNDIRRATGLATAEIAVKFAKQNANSP